MTELLKKAPIKESGLSRISLSHEYRFINNERQRIGYAARIGLKVVPNQLDHIEEVLSSLVSAGANEITATKFHTTKLKALRAQARTLAMQAAREKAEIYANAGGESRSAKSLRFKM